MAPGATLCLLKRCVVERPCCLPSIWVSYRGRQFKRSSPLHADTNCASARAEYVCWSVRACKCVGTDASVQRVGVCTSVFASLVLAWLCVFVCCPTVLYCILRPCVFTHSVTAVMTGFDLWPGPSASRHNEHVITGACETPALIPPRTAGGACVSDPRYHYAAQSVKGKCQKTIKHKYYGSIVVISLDLSIIIFMQRCETKCENVVYVWSSYHRPSYWVVLIHRFSCCPTTKLI